MALISVQALRALAAVAVILCHLSYAHDVVTGVPDARIPLYSLASGVDLFFAISGFIMVYSSERGFGRAGEAKRFLSRRLLRIVPIYWLATSLSLAVFGTALLWPNVIASFLFIPTSNYPALAVGWTLNFEMFFYCLFATFLFLPRGVAVTLLSALLAAIVLSGWAVTTSLPLRMWSDPIILEFVFGMLIAVAYRNGVRLHALVRMTFVIGGIVAVFFYAPVGSFPTGDRFLGWGLPASFILAGAVLGRCIEFGRMTSTAQVLGDSSYAMYLLHPFFVSGIILHWNPILNAYPYWLVAGIAAGLSVACAVMVHWLIERPTALYFRPEPVRPS